MYLVVSRYEDEPYFCVLSKENLIKMLNDPDEMTGYDFLVDEDHMEELPNKFPARSMLILQIKTIIPKEVTIVTKYEI